LIYCWGLSIALFDSDSFKTPAPQSTALLVGQEDIHVLLLHLLRDATQDVDLELNCKARPDLSKNLGTWMLPG